MRKFPSKTITRAFLYIRALEDLIQQGTPYVSSQCLAEMTGVTDVQVRKDVSVFGKVGKPRIGYSTEELKKVLEDFVIQNVVHVALFGVGNLGAAIMRYPGFQSDKIKLVAAFDKDAKKIGKRIKGVLIQDVMDAPRVIPREHIEIGIVAVPKVASQDIVDVMIRCGLKGIVNFSPTSVHVPEDVSVKHIDLSIEFLSLFCEMQS